MAEWIVPALGATLFWGFWVFLPKVTTRYINPRSETIYEIVGWLIAGTVTMVLMKLPLKANIQGGFYGVMTGIFGFLGGLCFLEAVLKEKTSAIVILTALYPLVTVLMAVLIPHESISMRQCLGIVCAIAAIFLISS